MNAKRSFVITALASLAIASLVACSEEKKNQTLRPYSGPRDSGADALEESDATTDVPVTIADSGADARRVASR